MGRTPLLLLSCCCGGLCTPGSLGTQGWTHGHREEGASADWPSDLGHILLQGFCLSAAARSLPWGMSPRFLGAPPGAAWLHLVGGPCWLAPPGANASSQAGPARTPCLGPCVPSTAGRVGGVSVCARPLPLLPVGASISRLRSWDGSPQNLPFLPRSWGQTPSAKPTRADSCPPAEGSLKHTLPRLPHPSPHVHLPAREGLAGPAFSFSSDGSIRFFQKAQ